MINAPIALVHDSCQAAWLDVVRRLAASHWEMCIRKKGVTNDHRHVFLMRTGGQT